MISAHNAGYGHYQYEKRTLEILRVLCVSVVRSIDLGHHGDKENTESLAPNDNVINKCCGRRCDGGGYGSFASFPVSRVRVIL